MALKIILILALACATEAVIQFKSLGEAITLSKTKDLFKANYENTVSCYKKVKSAHETIIYTFVNEMEKISLKINENSNKNTKIDEQIKENLQKIISIVKKYPDDLLKKKSKAFEYIDRKERRINLLDTNINQKIALLKEKSPDAKERAENLQAKYKDISEKVKKDIEKPFLNIQMCVMFGA